MDRPYEFIYFIDFPIDNSVPMVIVVDIGILGPYRIYPIYRGLIVTIHARYRGPDGVANSPLIPLRFVDLPRKPQSWTIKKTRERPKCAFAPLKFKAALRN